MIQFPYVIKASRIAGAGKGIFTTAAIPAGKVLIAPSKIDSVVSMQALMEMGDDSSPDTDSSVRWFESSYTVSPDWPDECFVNHCFSPNGLWHLGFVFALRDIAEDEEITMDYSHIIAPDYELEFRDSVTSKPIRGLGWKQSLIETTEQLLKLAKALPEAD